MNYSLHCLGARHRFLLVRLPLLLQQLRLVVVVLGLALLKLKAHLGLDQRLMAAQHAHLQLVDGARQVDALLLQFVGRRPKATGQKVVVTLQRLEVPIDVLAIRRQSLHFRLHLVFGFNVRLAQVREFAFGVRDAFVEHLHLVLVRLAFVLPLLFKVAPERRLAVQFLFQTIDVFAQLVAERLRVGERQVELVDLTDVCGAFGASGRRCCSGGVGVCVGRLFG